jgi:hypothetical protein
MRENVLSMYESVKQEKPLPYRLNHSARDAGAAVSRWLARLIVRAGVHDECASIGVEQGRATRGERDPIGREGKVTAAIVAGDQVGRVTRMRPGRVSETMIPVERIVVGARSVELRATFAPSDGVEMDPVRAGRE